MNKILTLTLFLFIVNQSFSQTCSGVTTKTAFTGSFEDGSGASNYTNWLSCSWLIQPIGANYVSVTFDSFDTEATYDLVTVYDGNTAGIVLGGPFSGLLKNVSTMYSQNSSVLIMFTSDGSGNAAGWNLTYSGYYGSYSTCYGRQSVNASSGVISDGSGGSDYSNNLACEWLIQPTGASWVNIQLLSFSTESGLDTLVFYDGPTNASTVLGSYSGTLGALPSLSSSNGSVLVVFRSDSSITSSGWSFNYTAALPSASSSIAPSVTPSPMPSAMSSYSPASSSPLAYSATPSNDNSPTCSGHTVLSSSSGYLEDGSGFYNYTNYLYCEWLIQSSADRIDIFINSLQLESADSLTLYDGLTNHSANLGIFTGQVSNVQRTSSTGVVLIVFETDYYGVNQGWSLSWQGWTNGGSSSNNDGSGGASKGVVAGAAVGGAVAVGAAAVCIAVFVIRRKKNAGNSTDIEMSNDGRKGAKEKKEGESANPFFTALERKEFLPIGIPDIDDLFSKVQAPLDTLCDMSDSISAATEAIASLDQQRQDVAQVAQASFADQLKFVLAEAAKTGCQIVPKVNGTEITLQVVGQGSSQILQAVDSITTLIKSAMDVVLKTPEIIKQLIELGKTASEFPPKIKDMAASAGLSFMKIPKAIKNLSLNIEYLAAAPNDVKAFMESIQQLVQTLKEVFGIGGENPALPQDAPTSDPTVALDTTQLVANNNNQPIIALMATAAALQEPVQVEQKKIFIKRMNKRGGAEMWLPNTLEELLAEGGKLLGINAIKARNADEFLISDVNMIEANQKIYLTDANDEAEF